MNKEKINSEQFKNLFNDEFTIVDVKDKMETEYILSALIAIKNDNSYQIEFLEFEEEFDAETTYESNYNELLKEDNNIKEKEEYNYSKFSYMDDEYYYLVSRISNTLIYVKAPVSYNEEINSILENTNY